MCVRDICIWVHSKYLGSISQRQFLNVVDVLLDNLEDWYAISLIELECGLEHPFIEPELQHKQRFCNSKLHKNVFIYPGIGVQ